jgi:hypothetical protein
MSYPAALPHNALSPLRRAFSAEPVNQRPLAPLNHTPNRYRSANEHGPCGASSSIVVFPVLAFTVKEAGLHVARIGAEVTGMERRRRLHGRIVRSPRVWAAARQCRQQCYASLGTTT